MTATTPKPPHRTGESTKRGSGTGKWLIGATILVGVALGLGGFTFHYGQGLSYLSADPKACANCHIMNRSFDSWQKSGHHTVATCSECHLPSPFFPKYISKMKNGWRHSVGFTFDHFHEPIQMTEENALTLQQNCVRCHSGLVHLQTNMARGESDHFSCVHCHATVGHGERAGLGGSSLKDKRGED